MKTKNQTFGFNSTLLFLAILLVWAVIISSSFFSPFSSELDINTKQIEASHSPNVFGYAWSDNIGWISFNCAGTSDNCVNSDYGVSVDVSGDLSGQAWSDNIGWISFNASDVSGCPAGVCQPRLSGSTVLGWAKALSADNNGWDGWISLSCSNTNTCDTSNYGVTLSGLNFQNYAWGSDVVGWLQWNPAFGGVVLGGGSPPTVSLSANPTSVPSGSASTLTWTTTNALTCSASGGWSGIKPTANPPGGAQSESTGNLTDSKSYTLTCTNAFGFQSTPPINVIVEVPQDFSLSSTNNITKSQIQTNSSVTKIKVIPGSVFTSEVSLSATLPPSLSSVGATYVFEYSTLSSTEEYEAGSDFYIRSVNPVPPGQYTITITGTSGALIRNIDISLNVSDVEGVFREF